MTGTSLPPRLRSAGSVIRAGGVIAYPTEGVYGLGCRPDDPLAVRRILDLKQRPVAAGLVLIAADPAQLDGWIEPTPVELARLLAPAPGPTTWLVRAGPLTPAWITGGRPSVAVRVTRHPVAAGLCQAAGLPLVSTSANRRGKPPARSAVAVRRFFGAQLDRVVGGATGGAAGPSAIRDGTSGAVIRAG
jgi:L-threonylcarbamoyladenylate synthase